MVVGEFSQDADLVIIGGGPAGYSCAFRAAELGQHAVLIDSRDQLGGVCLHAGCIPSKTLLHVTNTIDVARDAHQFGVRFDPPQVDVLAMRQWVQATIDKLARGLAARAKSLGVERITGEATFDDSRNLRVSGGGIHRLHFRRAVIATGARPLAHPTLPFDEVRVLTPGRSMQIERVPRTMLVVGCEYEAIEIANIHAALGSQVTLITERPALLPNADADLVRPLHRQLSARLHAIGLDVRIASAAIGESSVRIEFDGAEAPQPGEFEQVVIATGHRANLDELNIHATGVLCDECGFIRVDQHLRTSDGRMHAIGDVTGAPLLADAAIHQGRVCAEVIAGWNTEYDPRATPFVAFTNPQIAWCGLTEREARQQGACAVKKIPWGASGRAVAMGQSDGLTKIIYDPDTQLVLGAGIVGAGAAEMIGEAVLAIEMGAVLTDIASSMHPHPTISELIAEAAQQAEHEANGAKRKS